MRGPFPAETLSRWVWLINGVILLAVLLVAGASMLVGWATSGRADVDLTASADSAPAPPRPARIRADPPIPVEGAEVSLVLMRATRGLPGSPVPPAGSARGAGEVVNVAFLDGDGAGRLLLDRPARIAWITFRGAPEWLSGPLGPAAGNRMRYAIITEDRDGDGSLQAADGVELFESGARGEGLRRVLTAGLRLEWAGSAAGGARIVVATDTSGRQRTFRLDGDRAVSYGALDSLAAHAAEIVARR